MFLQAVFVLCSGLLCLEPVTTSAIWHLFFTGELFWILNESLKEQLAQLHFTCQLRVTFFFSKRGPDVFYILFRRIDMEMFEIESWGTWPYVIVMHCFAVRLAPLHVFMSHRGLIEMAGLIYVKCYIYFTKEGHEHAWCHSLWYQ